ncbi:site-specific integrase [Chryseobacterium takakiae]|uniref:Site-specific recombinase XerD n=1 Tax=Chryseobacterium takakiae TaxID=1302685 RepID=A0A1M4ZZ98_9FLAO|nr:site-specific integrase [Chryseobacterium takakiae]SHF23291.1 Site-specific recombinase XerD [Chryseobacterium takakiae]
MNTSIKIVLDSKPMSNGQYSVYLQIIKARQRKKINIGLKCYRANFKNEQFLKGHQNYKAENKILNKIKVKAEDIVRDFQLDDKDFSLEEFEDKFRGKQINRKLVIPFFDEIIDELTTAHRLGNARAYKETKNALLKFSNDKIKFTDITPEFLEKFEVDMRSRGNIDGGIAFKMRELRSLINKAIQRKIMSKEDYPFDKYLISKLKTKTKKRALTEEDFRKFKNVDLSDRPELLEAYHYFMFSFYTRGMNFVDMMKLKKSDIKNNRIIYTRSKTKGDFSLELNNKAKDIINYYSNRSKSEFVFPILLHNEMTPLQIENRKHKILSRFNNKLREIAKIAKIETHLTSYVARHSFATIMKNRGASTDIISELMGHSNVQVTMTYLKEFGSDVLDDAVKALDDL